MNPRSVASAFARLPLLACILSFCLLTSCSGDNADKSGADFAKYLIAKHLPDGEYKDVKASMQGDKAILEYATFINPWKPDGPNYSFSITKFTTPTECKNRNLTFKNSGDVVIDGVFAIIPMNSSVDKEAVRKVKAAWAEFKKGAK